MNALNQVNFETRVEHTNDDHHKDSQMFSRARHFGAALLPAVIGVAYVLTFDYLDTPTGSASFNTLVFAMFLAGIGSALTILHEIHRAEIWERKNGN